MKKNYIYLIIIVLCATSILLITIFTRQAKPEIKIEKESITLNCNTNYQSLLQYATVDDGVSVIIQQQSLADIQRLKRITYVAINENNQVTKVEIPVIVDNSINKIKLMTLKPLQMELETPFNINDYFKLVDGCNNVINETLQINNFDETVVGVQEVEISTLENPEMIYHHSFEITSYVEPQLELKNTKVEIEYNAVFNPETYIASLVGNFNQDISIKHKVDTKIPGEYIVDYSIEDIKGNILNKKLTVIVKNEEEI